MLRPPLVEPNQNKSSDELKEVKKLLEEVDRKQARLAAENESMKEGMKKMMNLIESLEGKLR